MIPSINILCRPGDGFALFLEFGVQDHAVLVGVRGPDAAHRGGRHTSQTSGAQRVDALEEECLGVGSVAATLQPVREAQPGIARRAVTAKA